MPAYPGGRTPVTAKIQAGQVRPQAARRDAYVLGVGMTRFGEHWEKSYRDLMTQAGLAAIQDAGVAAEDIDAVYVGTMSTGKLTGQEHVAPLLLDGAGLAGLHIPATRVEAAGASGGLALRQGVMAIRAGMADVVVVGGMEKMTDVSDADAQAMASASIDQEWEHVFGATEHALWAILAKRHMAELGTTREHLAEVAVKNHRHGERNPLAQFRKAIDAAAVLRSPKVADPLTVFDCAPLADGAACIVLGSPDAARARSGPVVRVAGSGQASDSLALHDRASLTALRATQEAARRAYVEAQCSPGDMEVAEVHDITTVAEILAIEDLGFVRKGEGGPATLEGRTTFGGDIVVNPSGGLKARGHPAGATGIAQACELAWQLRGQAESRQVANCRLGLAHGTGGTGATAVVHVLERGEA